MKNRNLIQMALILLAGQILFSCTVEKGKTDTNDHIF